MRADALVIAAQDVRPTELHDHLWQAIYDMPVPEDFVQRSTLTQD